MWRQEQYRCNKMQKMAQPSDETQEQNAGCQEVIAKNYQFSSASVLVSCTDHQYRPARKTRTLYDVNYCRQMDLLYLCLSLR